MLQPDRCSSPVQGLEVEVNLMPLALCRSLHDTVHITSACHTPTLCSYNASLLLSLSILPPPETSTAVCWTSVRRVTNPGNELHTDSSHPYCVSPLHLWPPSPYVPSSGGKILSLPYMQWQQLFTEKLSKVSGPYLCVHRWLPPWYSLWSRIPITSPWKLHCFLGFPQFTLCTQKCPPLLTLSCLPYKTELLQSFSAKFALEWVPSHQGIHGN
jgi:hypothetical protein